MKMTINDITERSGNLPSSSIADVLNSCVRKHNCAIVTAPPGAGKSTLLPLTLLAGLDTEGKILMLEPRRLAARQIAERMADILGEKAGETVGYRVRFESKVSAKTRIEVLTEGILTRMLVDDATLDGVDMVIFDEFHERSINTDLALALTRQTQQVIRPDLKIVIMSATIATENICKQFDAPLIESEGRMFPVSIVNATEDTTPASAAVDTARAILSAHRNHEGDILAFLPGQGDIERCMDMLGAALAPTNVYPLYGNLSPEQQRKAIAPSRDGERKVVLATPIAETSITIEGVRVVIDTGLCRSLVFNGRTGLSRLETVRISMDMATQRSGRAGRVAPGTCYRLWTLASEHNMAPQRKPEIETQDLAPLALSVAAFGESNIETLPWLDVPPTASVAKAVNLLTSLGALDEDRAITPLGRKMSEMPCHPRIARMILGANTSEQKALACDIAALLEEKNPMSNLEDTDIAIPLYSLRSAREKHQTGRWKQAMMSAQEYLRMAHVKEDNNAVDSFDAGQLLALAYPERIAMATNSFGGYRMANGQDVVLAQDDTMLANQWIVVASLYAAPNTKGTVFVAAPVHIDDVASQVASTRDNVSWDSRQGCVVMQREERIGKLTVGSCQLHNADNKQIIDIICKALRKDGLSMLTWDDKVQRLQRRVQAVATWHPDMNIPDISTEHLLDTASEWLPIYLTQGNHLLTTTSELKKLNLAEIVWNIIPYDQQQEIDRLAPTHITVPTGSRILIDYRQGAQAPIVSVRLQECFGMTTTPCVDDGRCPVLMELLSPGFKPVQLTQDIESFWSGTYFEIRKELRRRYPKHYWPENPLEAEAVRGVKRRDNK